MPYIKVKNSNGVVLPEYKTVDSSGFDISSNELKTLAPGESRVVHTGLYMEIEPGYEVQIRPRSGIALKHGVTVLNSPGTIDADYRGEVKILLINLGKESFHINPGDRIAQGICAKYERADISFTENLSSTERGENGFESTGRKS